MSESTDAAAGGRRGGRTVSKSTPDEVMELACGLPLTRSVLRSVVAGATCIASMFVGRVRQCFSAVWADGFPRCRHRFPVM